MLKVLIVEDEILVSIGLKTMINWPNMNMLVVGEARNGEEAYALYQREKPDIILTDIRMPVMDGLQLISKIRETDSKTKIIILTCYQEFDLVHKALKLGVSDYILKLKMSTEEMESVVSKVRSEIEAENMNRLLGKYTDADIRLTKNSLIHDYVLNPFISESEFANIAEQLHLRIKASRLVLCLMNIENFSTIQRKFEPDHENTLRNTTINIIEELLKKHGGGEAVHERDGRYLLIFSYENINSDDGARADLFKCLSVVGDSIKSYVNATVAFGISSFGKGYASLKGLYAEAVSSLEQNYFSCNKHFLQYGQPGLPEHYFQSIGALREYVISLREFNSECKREMISDIDQLLKLEHVTRDRVQETFIRWIHLLMANTHTLAHAVETDVIEYAGCIRSSLTLNRTIEIFRQYLQLYIDTHENTRVISREVAAAVNYINDNYNQSISLQKVADKVDISSNYLSSLFRKELQICFIDYINSVRINKAKELLISTHLKTYEISQKVGFENESYFSRIFKRQTGLRPNEYKRITL